MTFSLFKPVCQLLHLFHLISFVLFANRAVVISFCLFIFRSVLTASRRSSNLLTYRLTKVRNTLASEWRGNFFNLSILCPKEAEFPSVKSFSSNPPSPPTSQVDGAAAAPSISNVAPQFFQLALNVDCARLTPTSGLLKPNPYVEVILDGKPPKRTEICKSTYQPRWSEPMTVLVTPYSKLLFRLYDHSAFKKDTLVGEGSFELYPGNIFFILFQERTLHFVIFFLYRIS